jgi:DNA replication protein DnaC
MQGVIFLKCDVCLSPIIPRTTAIIEEKDKAYKHYHDDCLKVSRNPEKYCSQKHAQEIFKDGLCEICYQAYHRLCFYCSNEVGDFESRNHCSACECHAIEDKNIELEKQKASMIENEKSAKTESIYNFMFKLGGLKAANEFSFETYKVNDFNMKAFTQCRDFDPKKNNILLFGGVGSGKTHLAYATVRKIFEESFTPKIKVIKQPDLLREIRMKDPEVEQEIIDSYADADVLIIDDFGVGRSTEFANQILYEILDNRIMDCRNGLIVTSNFSLEELSKKMEDQRLPDRLAGLCKVFNIKADSFRLKNRKV